MIDADGFRENEIVVNIFYNLVSRCRKVAADQISVANYGHLEIPRPTQDVVPIDILFWNIFRNSIQNHRCKNRTMTMHIQLKVLSAMIQICSCSHGDVMIDSELEDEEIHSRRSGTVVGCQLLLRSVAVCLRRNHRC